MKIQDFVLQGRYVRLEPLAFPHVEGLVAASAVDLSLYQWSPIPQGEIEATKYIEIALAWKEAGTAVPFAIIHQEADACLRNMAGVAGLFPHGCAQRALARGTDTHWFSIRGNSTLASHGS